jgi:hypothetical protein
MPTFLQLKDFTGFFATNVVQNDMFFNFDYTCLILLSPASQFLPSQTNLYS